MACRTATSPAIPGNSCNSCCRPNASRCWTVNWRWRRGKRSCRSARSARPCAVVPDGQPWRCTPKGGSTARTGRAAARFYLSLPQSDWAQWLPAGLTQEWKIVRAKAGGDFWFDWRDGKAQRLVARLLAPRLKASCRAQAGEINDLGMNLFFDREAGAGRFGSATWRRISASSAGAEELLLRRDQQNNEATLEAAGRPRRPDAPGAGALAPLPDAAAEWVAGLKPKGHPAQPERRFLAAARGA